MSQRAGHLSLCSLGMDSYRGSIPKMDEPPPFYKTPPGQCDNCGGKCFGAHQVGHPCYRCDTGTFMHHSLFVWWWCPACWWTNPFCEYCKGNGVIGTPME